MLVVFSERLMPEGADVVSETVPENAFNELSMIVDVPEAPCWMLMVSGILLCEKSTTLIENVTDRTRVPLVPVTTIV